MKNEAWTILQKLEKNACLTNETVYLELHLGREEIL